MLNPRLEIEHMNQKWDENYQNNVISALKRLQEVKGVILGFHSVIDGIKRVRSDEIETILNANLKLKQSVQEKINAIPALSLLSRRIESLHYIIVVFRPIFWVICLSDRTTSDGSVIPFPLATSRRSHSISPGT